MFKFSFETTIKDKQELKTELTHLLWQIDHTWPSSFYPKQLNWIKSKSDQSSYKITGGIKRQSLEKEINMDDIIIKKS
jgi:hypothetical protein